jgi:hypothetical protein
MNKRNSVNALSHDLCFSSVFSTQMFAFTLFEIIFKIEKYLLKFKTVYIYAT